MHFLFILNSIPIRQVKKKTLFVWFCAICVLFIYVDKSFWSKTHSLSQSWIKWIVLILTIHRYSAYKDTHTQHIHIQPSQVAIIVFFKLILHCCCSVPYENLCTCTPLTHTFMSSFAIISVTLTENEHFKYM